MIYKYYKNIEFAKQAVINRHLFFSNVSTFNDPYERMFIFKDKDTEQVFVSHDSKISGMVCCFSKDQRSYLMWSHYANSHSGVCIGYDFSTTIIEKEKDGYAKCIINGKEFVLSEVNYDVYIPSVDMKLMHSEFDETIKAFSNKMECWKYEKEIRAIRNAKDSNIIEIPRECIKEIYYGWYYDESREMLQKSIKENQVDIKEYKMSVDFSTKQMFYMDLNKTF